MDFFVNLNDPIFIDNKITIQIHQLYWIQPLWSLGHCSFLRVLAHILLKHLLPMRKRFTLYEQPNVSMNIFNYFRWWKQFWLKSFSFALMLLTFTNLIDVIKVTFRMEAKNIYKIRKMIFYLKVIKWNIEDQWIIEIRFPVYMM